MADMTRRNMQGVFFILRSRPRSLSWRSTRLQRNRTLACGATTFRREGRNSERLARGFSAAPRGPLMAVNFNAISETQRRTLSQR